MTKQVRSFFDRRAASFDSIYLNENPGVRVFNLLLRRAIYTRFEIALRESGDVSNKAVLDVGCGSGRYCVEYARRGARSVVGIDVAPRMLDLARALATQEQVADRCEFVEADLMQLELSQRFDIVLAMGVFDYVTAPLEFLRKIMEASRGLILASFPGRNLVRMHLRSPRYRLRDCPLHFYAEGELRELCAAAGLSAYKLEFIPHSGTGFVLVGECS